MSSSEEVPAIVAKKVVNCSIVIEPDGNYIFDKSGKNVLVKKQDGSTIFIPRPSQLQSSSPSVQEERQEEEEEADLTLETATRNSWTPADTSDLINLYKEHLPYFRWSSMKKGKVWEMIAGRMRDKSPSQARNKFKYLKRRYFRKDDEESAKFEKYWPKMDDIFGGGSSKRVVTSVAAPEKAETRTAECGVEDSRSPTSSRDGTEDRTQKCRVLSLEEVVRKRAKATQKRRVESRKRREERMARVKVVREVLVRLTRCVGKLEEWCEES